MNKTLRACVAFARFAQLYQIEPGDLAELILLADAAFRAAERECNTGTSADKARNRFEAKVADLTDFGVSWNGLGPTLTLGGVDVYLPSIL